MGDSAVKPKIGKPGIIGIVAGAVVLVAAAIAAIILLSGKNDLVATTIRFLRMQGTVSLLDSKDRDVSITENLRLNNGNKVLTATESFASLGLDDYKIVSLDQSSKTVVSQEGKKLELNLESGALYFNVTKALAEDESFDIKTSTMIVGIRGTCGYVSADDLFLVEGHVEVNDPTTGETFEVKAGEWLSRDPSTGKYTKKKYTLYDLPLLVISELARDDERRAQCLEVCGATEEEFWKYAMTLSPAYFDWADLEWPTFDEEVEEPEEEPVAEETVEEPEEEEVAEETSEETEEEKEEEEQPKEHSIAVAATECGTVSADVSKAKKGDTVHLTARPNGGCDLIRWQIDAGDITLETNVYSASFVMGDEDVAITAIFDWIKEVTPATYSVATSSSNANWGTVTSPTAGDMQEGTTVTLAAQVASNFYVLDHWEVTGNGTTTTLNKTTSSYTIPNYPVDIKAVFKVDSQKLGHFYDDNAQIAYLSENGATGQYMTNGYELRITSAGSADANGVHTILIPDTLANSQGNSTNISYNRFTIAPGVLSDGDILDYRAFQGGSANKGYESGNDIDKNITIRASENTLKGIASLMNSISAFGFGAAGATARSSDYTVATENGTYVFKYHTNGNTWTYTPTNGGIEYTITGISNANGYEVYFTDPSGQSGMLFLNENDDANGNYIPH